MSTSQPLPAPPGRAALPAGLPVLTVPGLWNSGPLHWQTHWEAAHPEWRRVQQADWDEPEVEAWTAALDRDVLECPAPPLLLAHSLGCVTVAHWARRYAKPPFTSTIAGAFLVAPSDVEASTYPQRTGGFAPVPLESLPFPSLLVISDDDEYVTPARARLFAGAWGSELVSIGDAGHVNGASGHGPWPQGLALAAAFAARLGP